MSRTPIIMLRFLKSLLRTCLKLIIGPSEHQVAQVYWLFWQDLTVPPSLRSAASHYYIIYVRCSSVSEAHGRFWIATGNKTHSYKGRSLHGNFPHVSPGHIFSSGTSHKLHISRFCSRDLLVHRWTVLQWRKPPCSVPRRLKGTQIYLCTATVCLCKARLVENWASQWIQE